MESIDIEAIFDAAVEETKDTLLDFIHSQLLSGERKDGSPIGMYSGSERTKDYIELKLRKGLFAGEALSKSYYDLYFSGEFYRSIIVKVTGDFIEVISTDSKLDEIEDNTGGTGSLDDALELNEMFTEMYAEILKPIIQNKIRNAIGI